MLPLYRKNIEYAKANGELSDLADSFNESMKCARAIDKAISENYYNNRLDTLKVFDTVVKEYGYERVAHVLAAQVYNHDWDGRYHTDVKAWAKEQTKELSAEFMEDSRDYYLNSHPILIDGFASTVIKEQERAISQANSITEEKQPDISANTKDRVKEITDQLEAGLAALFKGDNFRNYLNTMSKFHNYSFNNTMLIALQKPDATYVAGFNSWKKNFERSVNKGEKGIKIFAPAPYKIKKEQTKIDPDTELPVLDSNGKPVIEQIEVTIPAFKVVSVFDVSQTNGKELPTLGVDELKGDVQDFDKFFGVLKEVSPVPIKLSEIDGSAKGFYHQADKEITIKKDMSEIQTIKTAIHEISHAKLHDRDMKKLNDEKPKDRNTEEVEAESIAYTVCQHFGIDTSDYSFAYVASWGSGKDTPELKASLETIRSTASELITQIEDNLRKLEKERTADKSIENAEENKENTEPKEQVILSDGNELSAVEKPSVETAINSTIEKGKIEPSKSNNIIGNIPYKDISDKAYLKIQTIQLPMVEKFLEGANIQYSGRKGKTSTTITINEADYLKVASLLTAAGVKELNQSIPSKAPEKADNQQNKNIIGNTLYKDISEKYFVKMTAEKARQLAPILNENGVRFSGRISGDKVTLTIEKSDVELYKSLSSSKENIAKAKKEELGKAMQEYEAAEANYISAEENLSRFMQEYEELTDANGEIKDTELDTAMKEKFISVYADKKTADDILEQKESMMLMTGAEFKAAIQAQDTNQNTEQKSSEYSVYKQSFDYAQEHGEMKEFQASYKDNMKCLWDIKAAAAIYAAEGRLDDFLKDLTEKYGVERPLYILSRTIQQVDDMRFSPEARQIADDMMYKLNEMQRGLEKAPEIQEYTGKLPDSKITIEERNAYGYDSNELLPLTTEKALELFDKDAVAVYLLYPDGTEGQANERSEIENHKGIFGVETVDWERYQSIEKIKNEIAEQEPAREAVLFEGKCAAGIYQLKDIPENRDIRFSDFSYLENKGIVPDRNNYSLVYSFEVLPEDMKDKSSFLEQVFNKFNNEHPEDFTGHSLSVSDVVVTKNDDKLTAHYVDRIGFKELQEFGKVHSIPLEAPTVDKPKLSVAELEEKSAKSEPISLMNSAEAVHREKGERKPGDIKASKGKVVHEEKKPSILNQLAEIKKNSVQQSKNQKTNEKGIAL